MRRSHPATTGGKGCHRSRGRWPWAGCRSRRGRSNPARKQEIGQSPSHAQLVPYWRSKSSCLVPKFAEDDQLRENICEFSVDIGCSAPGGSHASRVASCAVQWGAQRQAAKGHRHVRSVRQTPPAVRRNPSAKIKGPHSYQALPAPDLQVQPTTSDSWGAGKWRNLRAAGRALLRFVGSDFGSWSF